MGSAEGRGLGQQTRIAGEGTRPDNLDLGRVRMHRIHEHVGLFGNQHGWDPQKQLFPVSDPRTPDRLAFGRGRSLLPTRG